LKQRNNQEQRGGSNIITISAIACTPLAPIAFELATKKQQHDQQQNNQPACCPNASGPAQHALWLSDMLWFSSSPADRKQQLGWL
jgi:hypothetical protein